MSPPRPAPTLAALRRLVLAALLGFGLALAAACSDAGSGSGAGREPANPIFYEIASAEGQVEGWMVGTIHALPDALEWRTPAIAQAAQSADLLVVEVADLSGGADAPAIYAGLARSRGLPPLEQRLPPDLREELAALLARGGITANDLALDESWAAALALARIDAPGDPAKGVDRALIDEFAGRPVRELEGLRGQLSIFDRLPETAQRAMLAAVVRESASATRDPERLLRAWIAGDAARIEASTREGILADPALREALLTGRNRRWMAQIGPMLEDSARPLIAVGAAHLVGPDGLAALLEAEGYRVRRLSAP